MRPRSFAGKVSIALPSLPYQIAVLWRFVSFISGAVATSVTCLKSALSRSTPAPGSAKYVSPLPSRRSTAKPPWADTTTLRASSGSWAPVISTRNRSAPWPVTPFAPGSTVPGGAGVGAACCGTRELRTRMGEDAGRHEERCGEERGEAGWAHAPSFRESRSSTKRSKPTSSSSRFE